MANICTNMFYAYSDDINNLNCIKNFLESEFRSDLEITDGSIEGVFDSRWTFPEEKMEELFSLIPNKNDIYMRCLSYEFGELYHALFVCDEDGWTEE